jgi:hypothetical protein
MVAPKIAAFAFNAALLMTFTWRAECRFRRKPAAYSNLMSATVPI